MLRQSAGDGRSLSSKFPHPDRALKINTDRHRHLARPAIVWGKPVRTDLGSLSHPALNFPKTEVA